MKILANRISPVVAIGALILVAIPALSQEFFREFGTSQSPTGIGRLSPSADVFTGNAPDGMSPINSLNPREEDTAYNLRLGMVDFIIAAGIGVEFNDNITLSDSNEVSDIILRPEINIEGILRFSDLNTLRFGIGIGYAKYLSHSEFDSESVILSPRSSLIWTAKSGNLTFTVRERISYQEDAYDLAVLSNVANYRRWENQAGFEINWDATEYARVAVGFDRYDLWAVDDDFSSQTRAINTVFVRPSVDINPRVTVGLNGSVSWVNYAEDIQADGKIMLVGPFVQVKVSDVTDFYAEVGWQKADFSGGTIQQVQPGVFLEDTEDSASLYFKVQVSNRPTEGFRHSISASRTTETGLDSNYYDLYHFEYTADWMIRENTSITPTAFYEWYETSGNAPEKASRFGLALGIYHAFSNSITLGIDYRFLMKDSDQPDSDYTQNVGMLSLYYKF